MEQIWAPWRMKYILHDKSEECFLCKNFKQDNDAVSYILYRGSKNFVIMNLYPYNPGHLMIASCRHVASLEELTKEELHEHSEIVSRSIKVLRQTFDPQGFNIGVNIGKVAGVGLEGHVHTHVVPRWQGDTNFIPVISDTMVMSEALDETYKKLEGKL